MGQLNGKTLLLDVVPKNFDQKILDNQEDARLKAYAKIY